MPLSEEQITKIKAQHGDDLRVAETAAGQAFVFKRPSRQAYDRWFDKSDAKPSEAARELAQDCLAFPGWAEFIAALDKQPTFLMGGGGALDAIMQLAGVGESPAVKKL
jgi:hypothetical protein